MEGFVNVETDILNSPVDLLRQWLFRIHRMQVAHYRAAVVLGRFKLIIGTSVVICSSIVGSTLFATLTLSPSVTLNIALGFISLLAAILSGLQVFLRFGERAEKHRGTGSKFAAFRAETEQKICFLSHTTHLGEFMDSLRSRWFALNDEAPSLPASVWRHVEKTFKLEMPDMSKNNIA